MPDAARLRALLARLDGRPYPAWRDVAGAWWVGDVEILVDHVQGDPFAAPSRVRVRVPTGLGPDVTGDGDAACAAEDWLLRRFGARVRSTRRGSGRSGAIEVVRPGPRIVERGALRLRRDGVAEVRLQVGLPAAGRRVLGHEGAALLLDDLPAAAAALRDVAADPALAAHVASVRRQRALRRALAPAGLVAFVADGAILPRASGVDPAPLPGAVPFRAPPSLRVTLDTPWGPVHGLGVPRGVTVITGGGFHGKSTLLAAIASGWCDFVPGDGREAVVADPSVVKVRAEDGRRVCGVDISPFLRDLPGGRTTAPFHTDDASGSTSQAAAVVEAVEAGARVLVLDEDTSATNLLVRDARMQALVPRAQEPITPFVERVRQLVDAWQVSTVLVIGGVGDYLAVADTVIAMVDWVPHDVTARAHEVAGPRPDAPGPLGPVVPRVVVPAGLDARKVRAGSARAVRLDGDELDLTGVAEVADADLARTLGLCLPWLAAEGLVDGRRDLGAVLDAFDAILDDEGVDALSPWSHPDGRLVRPRRYEVAAALSRWRALAVT